MRFCLKNGPISPLSAFFAVFVKKCKSVERLKNYSAIFLF